MTSQTCPLVWLAVRTENHKVNYQWHLYLPTMNNPVANFAIKFGFSLGNQILIWRFELGEMCASVFLINRTNHRQDDRKTNFGSLTLMYRKIRYNRTTGKCQYPMPAAEGHDINQDCQVPGSEMDPVLMDHVTTVSNSIQLQGTLEGTVGPSIGQYVSKCLPQK